MNDTPANNTPLYIVGIITVVTIICVTAIVIAQPNNPNITILGVIAGIATTAGTTILNGQATRSRVAQVTTQVAQAATQVQAVHDLVNSQSAKLAEANKTIDTATGHAQGVADEKAEQANKTE